MMRTCKPRYRDTRDCPQRYVPVEVREAIRDKYAWPGGYPLYIVMEDGEALCVECGKQEYRLLAEASRDKDRSGWRPEAPEINYEDPDLYCCHCSTRIESAYAED